MRVHISHEAALEMWVDCDTTARSPEGRSSFQIHLPGSCVQFDDEADAEELWRQIGKRLGLDKPPSPAMMQRTRDWEVIQERLDKNKGESFG